MLVSAVNVFGVSSETDISEYKTVDISGYYSGKAYLNSKNYTSVSIESDDDFWDWGNRTQFKHNYALDSDSVEALKTDDGLVYDKSGIPFLWNTSGAIQVRRTGGFQPGKTYTNGATVDIENGAYSSINFLAYSIYGSKNYGSFTVDIIYTDGKVTQSVYINGMESNEITANAIPVKAYGHWTEGVNKGSENISFGAHYNTGVDTYSVQTDETRIIDKIRFYNGVGDFAGGMEQTKVLALTLKRGNPKVLEDKNIYNMIDIDASGNANSPIYMDENTCNNVVMEKADDYLSWGGAKFPNNFALDKISLSEHINDGVLTDKDGIPFSMPLNKAIAVGGKDGISSCVDLPDGIYDTVDFLAVSINGSKNNSADANFAAELVYTDGTHSEESITISPQKDSALTVCSSKVYLHWLADTNAPSFTLDTVSNNEAHINKYSVKPADGKTVDKIIFSNKTENMYFSYTFRSKILAVTAVKAKREALREKLIKAFLEIPEKDELSFCDASYISYTNELLEQFKTLGGIAEEITGYERFLTSEAKAEEFKAQKPDTVNIYVSPDGNDNACGNEEKPLKNLNIARENALCAKEMFPSASVNVILRGGEYRISETLYMYGDKGISYKAYPNEKAVLRGSTVLSSADFRVTAGGEIYNRLPEKAKGKVMEISLSEQGINIDSSYSPMNFALYINGKEQEVSQYPNGEGNFTLGGKRISSDTFTVKDEKAKDWANIAESDAYIGGNLNSDYGIYNQFVKSVDSQAQSMTVNLSEIGGLKENLMKYKIYHLPEELDSPGEWYADRENGILYYYPIGDFENQTVEFVCNEKPFITLKDTKDITFSNIAFSQNGAEAITAVKNGAQSCVSDFTVSGCEFSDLKAGVKCIMGEYSPLQEFESKGGENIVIKDNNFYNIWGKPLNMYGGKRITLTSNNSSVKNNYFYRCGFKGHTYFCVTFDYNVGTVVENNVFHNMRGIAVGYGGNEIKLKYNEVYNVMKNGTDGGAVYSGKSYILRGNEIAYNYIHDLDTSANEGHSAGSNVGIYLDDGLSGQYVHHNIISDVGIGVLFYGSDNTVEYNTIVNSKLTPISAQIGGAKLTGTMKDDLDALMQSDYRDTWVNKYPRLSDTYNDCSTPQRNILRKNIFDLNPIIASDFSSGASDISANYQLGMRKNSAFYSPDSQDYRLKEGNTYAKLLPDALNTANFDISKIGLYVNENRITVSPFSEEEKAFGLLYPKNGESVNSGLKADFRWENSLGADSYELVISEDSNMQNTVYREKTSYNNLSVPIDKLTGNKYYWCVYAKNNSRAFGTTVRSTEVYEFSISEICADTKKEELIDISAYCNEKTAMYENEKISDADISDYYGYFILNKNYVEKQLDENGCISLFTKKYKLPSLNGVYNAAGTYKSDITIPLSGLKYENISFLAHQPENRELTAQIEIKYSDGSAEIFTQDDGCTKNGSFCVPALDPKRGANNFWICSLISYSITPDKSKTAVSITFKKADDRATSLNLYALTCDTAEGVYLSNRSDEDKTADIINTQNENERIKEIKIKTFKIKAGDIGVFSSDKEGNESFIWDSSSLKPLTEKIKFK